MIGGTVTLDGIPHTVLAAMPPDFGFGAPSVQIWRASPRNAFDPTSRRSHNWGVVARLGGGCHVPIGARAQVFGELLEMTAIVAAPEGESFCRAELAGMAEKAELLGRELADRLLGQGADKILAAFNKQG